jgi:hypothetical protein
MSKLFGTTVGKVIWLASGSAFLVYLAKHQGQSADWFRNRSFAAIALLNPLVWSYWILFLVPLAGEILQDTKLDWKKLDARRNRGGPVLIFTALGFLAALYVLLAFASQHAKWAWNGGILLAMILVVGVALQRERKLSP